MANRAMDDCQFGPCTCMMVDACSLLYFIRTVNEPSQFQSAR